MCTVQLIILLLSWLTVSLCEPLESFEAINYAALNVTAANLTSIRSSLQQKAERDGDWQPHLPVFDGFPDRNTLSITRRAWAEMMLISQTTLFGVCRRSVAYKRYFSEIHAPTVDRVFKYILGQDGKGPYEVADPSWRLRIYYGDRPRGGDLVTNCHFIPGSYAWTTNDPVDGLGPMIELCPVLFLDVALKLDQRFTCDTIDEQIGNGWRTLSAVILHELTHWNLLTLKAEPDLHLRVFDYGYGVNAARRPNDGNPTDGYEAYNSMILNRFHDKDLRADQYGKHPIRNADSYAFFAVEEYWSQTCKRDFKDPLNDRTPSVPKDGVTDVGTNVPGHVAGNPPPAPPPVPRAAAPASILSMKDYNEDPTV